MAVLGLRYHYPRSQEKRVILMNWAAVGPIDQSVEQRTFNPLGLFTSLKQIEQRTTANPYFTLRIALIPLFWVSSHYPLLHPPANSFWNRIATELSSDTSPSTRNPASRNTVVAQIGT